MDAAATLEQLVQIDSVNATLGGRGEQEVGDAVSDLLSGLGADVVRGAVEGQPATNVIGRFPGPSDAPVIVLEAHLDTVPHAQPAQAVERSNGRLAGRGACDTKGSLVAMLGALERLADAGDVEATIVFAGAVDEEATMLGAAALVDQIGPMDAVVIGEPTSLVPVRAHNGFARIRIEARGRAAHTSKAYLGINALTAAARVAIALEERLLPRLERKVHPLIGPALVTPTVMRTGHAPNIVPEVAELVIDRRIAPSEELDEVLAELDELLDELRQEGHDVHRDDPFVILPGIDTPADHPLVVAALEAANSTMGGDLTATGAPYSTDACRMSRGHDVPCVVLGPGSIDQAHTTDEWVDLDEVERCIDVYAETVRRTVSRFAAG